MLKVFCITFNPIFDIHHTTRQKYYLYLIYSTLRAQRDSEKITVFE